MALSGKWKRFGCCPQDQEENPAPPSNLMVFLMTGYNYRALPELFDSTGQKIMSLQFSANHDKLEYRWKVYKKQFGNNIYHLSTSDDICPVIYNEMTGKRLGVRRISKHNGYTSWIVRPGH